MRTFSLCILIVLFLITDSRVMHAQTDNAPLNQIELMKQWIGTWKTEGTYLSGDIQPYGNTGLLGYQKAQLKDSVANEYKFIYGYDKKSDKYIVAGIGKDKPEIMLMVFWFTKENICEKVPFEYISNPESAPSRAIFEFKSDNLIKGTYKEKGKPDRIYTMVREKTD